MNTRPPLPISRGKVKYVLRTRKGEFNLVELMVTVGCVGLLAIAMLVMTNEAVEVSSAESGAPEPVKAPPAEVDLSWLWQVGVAILLLAVLGGAAFGAYRLCVMGAAAKRAAGTARHHAAALVKTATAGLNTVMLASAAYETDLAKQIDYPIMTDVTDPAVSAYLKDMRRAQDLQPLATGRGATAGNVEKFVNAVHSLELSFKGAEAKAERLRWSSFTEVEKGRLKDAQTALAVIYDASTTPEQRNALYRRITKLLDGLITITAPALQELSAVVPMLVLEAREPQAA